ncbi:hypothetical protein OJAV_G00011140 [Oryzias javanicus]|uniref:Ig-like domain-containing protein n=1 Tax=Oryzias javanicus TaxID=123683 RepID=A0A437DP41_ORYJA|nr:hypothetical protein OJAV_G00011140 [Oryzias javanicus]
MSLTAALRGFVVFLCWFSEVKSQDDGNVIYSKTEVCADKGSTVSIWCSYDYPEMINGVWTTAEKSFWFIRTEGEPKDLKEDPEYKDRVKYNSYPNYYYLRISGVRESDSAVYKFRFITNHQTGRYIGEPGVRLTVRDLQVLVVSTSVQQEDSEVQLKCFNRCDPDGLDRYVWFKNGEEISSNKWSENSQMFTFRSRISSTDRISCSLRDSKMKQSPEVYLQSLTDWRVTYNETEVCADEGSTVVIPCEYDYPETINEIRTTVEKSFWFIRTEGEPADLKEDPEYKDRVMYSSFPKSSNLTISRLRESDSAVYKFRFITNHQTGRYIGEPGVRLTVRDLQVLVVSASVHLGYLYVQLNCFNRCDPRGLREYVWFKNGEETRSMILTDSSQTFWHKGNISSTDRISCSLRDSNMKQSPEIYAPQTPTVSLDPPTEILEGSSVTLTCSSDANPAANYTWYKRINSTVELLSLVPKFVFSSIQSKDSGEYYCKVQNKLGWATADMTLVVKCPKKTKKNPRERKKNSRHPKTQRRTKEIRTRSVVQQPSKDPPTQEEKYTGSRPAAVTSRSSAAFGRSGRVVAVQT